ncbi:NOG2 [Hepatospora eriocheir]|uniref:Nucleolar GTP-binding protein 2 n=1 Tax=Hepatospora eriocheir TaxID=1081669 RepID=A0A1X0QBD4_9MICR|nr:NOG2 [Hepatospora eriocheir]
MVKENYYSFGKTKYLNNLNSGKAKKNSRGEIIKEASFQSTKKSIGRIEPSRHWFNPTKVIDHNELDKYRNSVRINSPYEVLLKSGNVPGSLVNNVVKKKKHDFIFDTDFNSKRIKIAYNSLEDIKKYNSEKIEKIDSVTQNTNFIMTRSSSKATWTELYKVLDSSDVVVHVLDARNPKICSHIENYLEKHNHKYLIYVLNKVDLVPKEVTTQWINKLNQKHPVVAYHALSRDNYKSNKLNFGKENLTRILRQLKRLYLTNNKNKHCISVGFVGYPNTGKSSIINSLRGKDVCKVAPIPGETRVWQYITLFKDLYLIDSPGVIPITNSGKFTVDDLLNGGLRIESMNNCEMYVWDVVERVGKEKIIKFYDLKIEFDSLKGLLRSVGKRMGFIRKGGIIDEDLVAKRILTDFVRGKLPYYVKV